MLKTSTTITLKDGQTVKTEYSEGRCRGTINNVFPANMAL